MSAPAKLSARERFVSDLEQEVFALRDHIADGGCETWEEYRSQTGRLRGLSDVYRRFSEMLTEEGDEE